MSFDDDQSCIVQLDSDIYEERFRVDRRKLEEMLLQVDNRTNSDCAEIFFQTIMNITDTHISWPSKLKIGAKSKKDPHIKVMGRLSAVQDAKEKILDVLDTKCNRVTLKMDVSHTEHSHVIGKGGNNIKKVMQETGCHIHFPDSNRNSQMEKSNQVSIAGQAVGAEKARAQIRELLPLVFMFDLPMHNTSQPILPDSSSPHVQHIQQLYNVTVTFKQRPRLCVTQVLVRGTVNNANAVKEGTASVIKLYAGSIAPSIPVSVTIEIAPQHHVFIMGRGGSSIQAIMQRTGATIHFPDQANVLPQRKSTVYITGAIDNVYLARQLLIGCLPLVLMFDIKDSQEIEPTVLASMMEELDVFISVKPKPRQSSKSVIVKSMERNGPNMFEARRRLLGLDRDPALPAPRRRDVAMPPLLSHEQLGCKSMFVLPSVGQDQNLATNQLWQMLPPHLQNAGPPPLLPSTNAATVAAHLAALPNLLNPALPPMDLAELQHQLGLKLSATHDYNQNNSTSTPVKMTGQRSRDFPTNDGISSSYEDPLSDRSCSPSDELYQTVSRSNSTNNTSCSTSGISSNGSDTLSNNGVDDVLGTRLVNMKISLSPSDSGSSCDLAAMTSPQTSSPQREKPPLPPPGLIHPSARKQSLLLEENIKNAHVPFCNSDSGSKIRQALQAELSQDKRAPGSDRPGIIIQHQLMNQQQQQQQQYGEQDQYSTSPFNYEEKKLLATRAMQKKPEGESRFPTDFWAGLGFSKSMPDQAIREKLKAINARFRESQQASNIISEGVESYDSESDAGGPVYNPIGPDYTNQKPKQGGYGYGLSSRSDWSPSSSGSSSSCISHSRYANIPDLFSELGLDKYTDKFMEQEIDLPTFLTLSEHDLKELGITKFGARRKMLLAIAELNKKPVNGLLPSSVERTPTKTVPTSPERTSGTPPYSQYPFPDQSLFARPHVQFISQSGRW